MTSPTPMTGSLSTFEAWVDGRAGTSLRSGFDGSLDYPLGNLLRECWQASERAAPNAAGFVEQHARDSAELRRLCEARDEARRTAEHWKAEHLAGNKEIARLTAELEAAKRDTDRLDFMLSNDAFTVTCNRDGSILQHQLMTQDEDENYHVLHNERRFYNTERDAIDAAIECAALSASSDGAGKGDQS